MGDHDEADFIASELSKPEGVAPSSGDAKRLSQCGRDRELQHLARLGDAPNSS